MRKYLLAILVLSVVVLAACSSGVETQGDEMMEDTDSMDEAMAEKEVKTFVLEGRNYDFLMEGEVSPTLTVNLGDTVRIEFTSVDGFHDWMLDEFNAATDRVNTGGSTSVEFVADEAGTFEYYCSVGQHRLNGMFGTFIVEGGS